MWLRPTGHESLLVVGDDKSAQVVCAEAHRPIFMHIVLFGTEGATFAPRIARIEYGNT